MVLWGSITGLRVRKGLGEGVRGRESQIGYRHVELLPDSEDGFGFGFSFVTFHGFDRLRGLGSGLGFGLMSAAHTVGVFWRESLSASV